MKASQKWPDYDQLLEMYPEDPGSNQNNNKGGNGNILLIVSLVAVLGLGAYLYYLHQKDEAADI